MRYIVSKILVDPKDSKYVYCNAEMLDTGTGVNPIDVSKILLDDLYLTHCVALFNEKELEKVTEEQCVKRGAFWRSVGRANISLEDNDGIYGNHYKPRIMRKVGLLTYLCDQYGVSQPRNIAALIGEIAAYESK